MKNALQTVIEDVDIIVLNDGQSLLESLDQNYSRHPAVILMDMNMPRVNGLEALHLLKANPWTQHIPVVMVSTSASQEHIAQAYRQGIIAFITKPVSILELEQMAQDINICFCITIIMGKIVRYLLKR
jgi:CheY-like chemotaxis protein